MIDSTKSKREHISNERSKAGKNGGAPKGNQNARKQAKTNKTNKTSVDVDVDVDDNTKTLSNESKESADKPRKVAAKRGAFVAPALGELRAYISEQGLTNVNPEEFLDHYTANGWRAGNNPMKDWKAAARNWNRRHKDRFTTTKPQTAENYETPDCYKVVPE